MGRYGDEDSKVAGRKMDPGEIDPVRGMDAMRPLVGLVLFGAALAPERGVPSRHVRGPGGLESWTLSYKLPADDGGTMQPGTLVVARRGHILRRIEGDPFVWRWVFVESGSQVAVEEGPLHFSMHCVLMEIASGRRLAEYDCFHDLPADAPAWVKSLEAAPDAP